MIGGLPSRLVCWRARQDCCRTCSDSSYTSRPGCSAGSSHSIGCSCSTNIQWMSHVTKLPEKVPFVFLKSVVNLVASRAAQWYWLLTRLLSDKTWWGSLVYTRWLVPALTQAPVRHAPVSRREYAAFQFNWVCLLSLSRYFTPYTGALHPFHPQLRCLIQD